MISRRFLLGGGAVGALSANAIAKAAVAAPSGPPTVREFFDDPTAVDAAVSPDGKVVAVLRQTCQRVPRDPLAKPMSAYSDEKGSGVVYKRQKPDKYQASIDFRATSNVDKVVNLKLGDLRCEKIAWANDELLLIWVIWESSEVVKARRLAVLSRDGKSLRYLLQKDKSLARYNPDHGNVVDLLVNDPKHIMVRMGDLQTRSATLFKVHLYEDTIERVDQGGQLQTQQWFLQDGVPVVRMDLQPSQKVISVMGRAPGEKDWKQLAQQPVVFGTPHDFEVQGAAKEPGIIRVATYAAGTDVKALYEYDLRRSAWGKRITQRNADVEAILTDGAGGYLGAMFVDDRYSYECPDPQLNEDLKVLTEAFPTSSVQVIDITPSAQHMVVRVTGPQQAGMFVYFNRQAGAVALLDSEQPWLTEDRLAPTEVIRVKSTGGQAVTAYVTGHPGKGKPMIVVPHGGPEARDQIRFDYFSQILAAQGWVVVQPNFRGSAGYGKAFADAGRRNWDTVMMEDIEACADAVIASGRADPKKVAIFGWSFGGYAALMCGVRRPDFYKAVVSVAGPSDLMKMLKIERLAGLDSASYQYWVKTIGDPDKDEERLRKASPAERSLDIKAPVLLIHGRMDTVVEPEQSRLMATPLRTRSKPHELVIVPGMAHSPNDREDSVAVFEKITGFLKTNLA